MRSHRLRIKPSKPASVLGMIVGLVFVGIGFGLVMPVFGGFGVAWTLLAAGITVYHAVNVFSSRGVAMTEIDLEGDATRQLGSSGLPFDERLRRLERLKDEQLISNDEYHRKREELMREEW